jgi:chemotaxis regulatin CheY-phosphate phosphatase CheZ
VHEAQATMGRINTSLSRIMEHLSFQDLSGQRLQKVLKLIRELQIQVLSLLVALGNKLKLCQTSGAALMTEADLLAQKEWDRMLDNLLAVSQENSDDAGPPPGQPLDQDSVNDLLTSMGFS